MNKMRSWILALVVLLTAPAAFAWTQGPGGAGRAMRRGQLRLRTIYANDFRESVPKFEAAVKKLEEELGAEKPKLGRYGKEIEKQTEVFLRYIKHVNEEHPSFKPEELTKYSNIELGWETLTSAETLIPILPRVVELENSATVNLKLWQLLYALEGELQRLKWMTSKLK